MTDFSLKDAKGNVVGYLNERLAKTRALTDDAIEQIKELHLGRTMLISAMEDTSPHDKEELRRLAKEIEQCDYLLQDAWGFPQDSNYHYWWRVPHCRCPLHENTERYGTPYRVVNEKCPVHGNIVDKG